MIKKIILAILCIGELTLLYCTISYFKKGASQPKIISTDGHTTFSWGFYTVGIVYAIITGVVFVGLIIYGLLAFKKKPKIN